MNAAIIAMRGRGHPLPLIAARFGLSTQRVYAILRDAGKAEGCLHILYGDQVPALAIRMADRAAAHEGRTKGIVADYQDGVSVSTIAVKFKCSKQYMYYLLKTAGVATRRARANYVERRSMVTWEQPQP